MTTSVFSKQTVASMSKFPRLRRSQLLSISIKLKAPLVFHCHSSPRCHYHCFKYKWQSAVEEDEAVFTCQMSVTVADSTWDPYLQGNCPSRQSGYGTPRLRGTIWGSYNAIVCAGRRNQERIYREGNVDIGLIKDADPWGRWRRRCCQFLYVQWLVSSLKLVKNLPCWHQPFLSHGFTDAWLLDDTATGQKSLMKPLAQAVFTPSHV